MDDHKKTLKRRIDELKESINRKENENGSLKTHEENLRQHTFRYRKIFDKSYISIWEGDASGVYTILESLPCSNGEELTEYLSNHPITAVKLIRNLKIVDVNDYTLNMFGAKSKKEFINSLDKIVTSESIPGCIRILATMKDGSPYGKHEITASTISGKKINLLFNTYLPGKGKGNILTSMVDISRRMQNEKALSHSINQAEEQKKRTEVLQSILLTLTTSLDKEEILNAILREAKRIVPYSCANIRLLENGYLRVAASLGYEDYGAAEYMKNSVVKMEELGDASTFLENGHINIISNTKTYPEWTVYPETSFIMGYIGLPINYSGKIIGLLSLESDRIDTFSQVDSEKLEPFAHAAAVALQRSLLFELTENELEKRMEIESSIRKSLSEKEILIKEIHHRVKNNLSLIMSLINLQSDMLPGNINPNIFEDFKQRVYTISLVHEKLYRGKNFSSVDLESYLTELTESIQSSSNFKRGIEFRIVIEDCVEIEADTIIPLALLLNELISNSVKYAFPVQPGIISINVSDEGKSHRIIIRDNGIGLPKNKEKSSSQFGLFLVKSLVLQIGGVATFHNDKGAVSTIIFPQK